MKRTLALFLAVMFVLTAAGCQGDPGSNTPSNSGTGQPPSQTTEAPEPSITPTPTLTPTPTPTPTTEPTPTQAPGSETPGPSAEPTFGVMDVFVFGIGKADAILITTENYTVMIDTGEDTYGLQIVEYLTGRDITVIDYLIITHFHKDHVGGADAILRNLDVGTVIVPDYGKDSNQYNQFLEAMDETGLERNILTQVLELSLDGVLFNVYPSQQGYYDYGSAHSEEDEGDYVVSNDDIDDENAAPKENNFSLVVSVNHGENNFLFAGDAESKRLRELLSLDDILSTQFNYLKAPHHGRLNKRSVEFIYAIRPEYAVITCSMDRPADVEVVLLFAEVGTEVFFAAQRGVFCTSDGTTLNVCYETG